MKIFNTYFFILISFFLLVCADARSQSAPTDSRGDLSENLAMAYQSAKEKGINDEQFIALAKQRGYKEVDIRAAMSKGVTNRPGGGATSGSNTPSQRQMVELGGDDIFMGGGLSDSTNLLTDYERRIFGFEVFANKKINFTPNLNMATPRDYVVGPGDQLVVQIYGIAEANFILSVSPEGKIAVPNVGVIHVGSLTIDAARAAIQQKLATRYPGIGGSNPSSFVMVTVGNIRSIKVNMVGELRNPGTYQLPSFSSVFNAIYVAGGPSVRGSFRNVQVFRANRLLAEVDLYEFLTKGITSKNIRLEDNDVILIPSYTKRIELKGAIRRAGFYEPTGRESLDQLITYAGGFTERGYRKNVSVQRFTDQQQQLLTVEEDKFKQFQFEDGDVVMIGEVLERFVNRVQVSGSINHSGDYELKGEMRVSDLIEQAGGVKADALMERATLYRSLPNLDQQIIALDLDKVLAGDPQHDVLLKREDYLSISSLYDSKRLAFVKLEGEVNNTGVFPYAENMTVKDLLLKAGGFKEAASATGIEIIRRTKDDPNAIATVIKLDIDKNYIIDTNNQAVILEPFDVVFVRTQSELKPYQFVYVNGEAQRTGQFVLDKPTVLISELLDRAGGVAASGDLKGAVLLRRTIFYRDPSVDEKYLSELREIRTKLVDSTGVGYTESSKVLLERIDREIKRVAYEQMINGSGANPLVRDSTISRGLTNNELAAELRNIKELRNNLQVTMIRSLNYVTINENRYEFVSINLDKINDPSTRESFDIRLKDGDILYIPPFDETVRVGGEVLYPVAVKYARHNSFIDYINAAGGFKSEALRKRSYLIESNGAVHSTKNFLGLFKFFPEVTPGSQIVVPKDTKVRSPFSVDRAIGLITSLITTYLLITTIKN